MGDVLAIPRLFDAVVARFTLDGTDVPNLFGRREVARQQLTKARIVWAPGDQSGSMGALGPAKYPGESASGPRGLATISELVSVYITTNDPADAESDRAQYIAARFLFDAWFRAVYLANFGAFSLVSTSWIKPSSERRHGAGIVAVLSVEGRIPDEAHPTIPTDSSVVANVTHVEDLTETIDVTSTDPEEP